MAPNQPPMRFMSATLMPMEVTVGVGIWGRRSAETLRVSKHGGLRGGSWEGAGRELGESWEHGTCPRPVGMEAWNIG